MSAVVLFTATSGPRRRGATGARPRCGLTRGCGTHVAVAFVRRLLALLILDGLLLAFLLTTWLAAQAVSDLLL